MNIQMAVAKLVTTIHSDGLKSNAFLIRPVTWKGSGSAITLDEEGRLITINMVGEDADFIPYDYEVLDDWECLSWKTVFKELSAFSKGKNS